MVVVRTVREISSILLGTFVYIVKSIKRSKRDDFAPIEHDFYIVQINNSSITKLGLSNKLFSITTNLSMRCPIVAQGNAID
jgi:hypothetical protein